MWIDDTEVGYVDCTPETVTFRRYLVKCSITSGNHVFKLSHTCDNPVNSNNTPCSVIDDVSLAESLLLNGDFDGGTVASEGWSSSAHAAYSNPGWTTSGTCGIAKPGVPGTYWISPEIDSGIYSLYTHVANYTNKGTTRVLPPVSIHQSFTVLKAGVVSTTPLARTQISLVQPSQHVFAKVKALKEILFGRRLLSRRTNARSISLPVSSSCVKQARIRLNSTRRSQTISKMPRITNAPFSIMCPSNMPVNF